MLASKLYSNAMSLFIFAGRICYLSQVLSGRSKCFFFCLLFQVRFLVSTNIWGLLKSLATKTAFVCAHIRMKLIMFFPITFLWQLFITNTAMETYENVRVIPIFEWIGRISLASLSRSLLSFYSLKYHWLFNWYGHR